jgi:hypothetical protein
MASNPWLIARHVTLDNYRTLLGQGQFLTYYRNTAVVTVLVVAISVAVSLLAAYSLSRLRFWGSALLATGVFLTYLGQHHGGRAAGGRAPRRRLRLPDGLLHRRADRGRHQGIAFEGPSARLPGGLCRAGGG